MTRDHLKNKDYVSAFDTILVASRIAASDPHLFDLVMTFIEQASHSKSDEAIALAEDLLERSESLVHFQSPKDVQKSRKRLLQVRKGLSKADPAAMPKPTTNSPFGSVSMLLKISETALVPPGLRSKAVEQARSSLDDALLDLLVSSDAKADEIKSYEIEQLQKRIDAAEKQCVTALFEKSKPTVETWLRSAGTMLERSKNISPDEVARFSKEVSKTISQGMEELQELMPYSKAGETGAAELSGSVEKQIDFLQRLKTWLYNQEVLRRIKRIESDKDMSLDKKIGYLAEVKEENLSPYFMHLYDELWRKVFEELSRGQEGMGDAVESASTQ